MNKTTRYIIALTVFATIMVNALTRAASIGDSEEFELYGPGGLDDTDTYISDFQKRMGCRKGYTYQAILRDCVPSLGELRRLEGDKRIYKAMRGRGRGRGGRARYH